MCDFISWIELPGKGRKPRIKFLTDDLIPPALERGIDPPDLAGHEAIRRVFGLGRDEGKERECMDFSSPSKFPPEIVLAILEGRMTGFGPFPRGILCKLLAEEYQTKHKLLGEEYWAKHRLLDKEYQAKYKLLDKEYWKLAQDPANLAPLWASVPPIGLVANLPAL